MTSEPAAELHPDYSSAGAAATPWQEVVAVLEVTAPISRLDGLLQHAWSASVADFDLGSGALQVLLALRRVGAAFELTPTDLCRDAFLSSGGMTQLLDRLEQRGLQACDHCNCIQVSMHVLVLLRPFRVIAGSLQT